MIEKYFTLSTRTSDAAKPIAYCPVRETKNSELLKGLVTRQLFDFEGDSGSIRATLKYIRDTFSAEVRTRNET